MLTEQCTPHDRYSKSNYFPPGHPQRGKDMYIIYITSTSLSNDKAPGLSLAPQFAAFSHHQTALKFHSIRDSPVPCTYNSDSDSNRQPESQFYSNSNSNSTGKLVIQIISVQ